MSALPRHVCGVLIRRPRGYPQTQLRHVEFGFGESRFCISDFVTRSGDTRFRDSMSARRVSRPVFQIWPNLSCRLQLTRPNSISHSKVVFLGAFALLVAVAAV